MHRSLAFGSFCWSRRHNNEGTVTSRRNIGQKSELSMGRGRERNLTKHDQTRPGGRGSQHTRKQQREHERCAEPRMQWGNKLWPSGGGEAASAKAPGQDGVGRGGQGSWTEINQRMFRDLECWGPFAERESHSVVSNSLRLHELYSPWNSPGQNTGVRSLSLLQGNLPNPEMEPSSPALRADSLPAEPQGKPKNTGVGSLSLLQQISLTQESNWGLLHCRQILYQPSY